MEIIAEQEADVDPAVAGADDAQTANARKSSLPPVEKSPHAIRSARRSGSASAGNRMTGRVS
ncbi:hypothetical protein XF35_25040 [Streptomyces platensis subsp. clarensis]|nr:hypothetical protein [Streptomyces platensis subsp. clarensis]